MTATLNPALKPFWTTRARNKILYGGRGSSKSWDAAGMAVFLAQRYKLRFLCVRQIQNKIEESVYALLKIQIERFGLTGEFRILDNKIIHKRTGSEFMFYGLWRHISEIKSIESIDILWSEESHALTEAQWEVLEPTIRKQGSECWLLFNPSLVSDFVWRHFVVDPPANTLVRHINFEENPFLAKTALDVIDNHKKKHPETFDHIYLGIPRTDDDESVIKTSWILAAIDAHKTIGFSDAGRSRMGFDVADSGQDMCAVTHAKGNVVYFTEEWAAGEDKLLWSCTKALHLAQERDAEVIYDSIGVGAAVGAKFNELGFRKHSKFNAGAAVMFPEKIYQPKITNKDFFANLKAQAWWLVADRFRLTYQVVNAIRNGDTPPDYKVEDLISISSDCPNLEKLKYELAIPMRDFDNVGRVKVESKKDLAKRDIKSPNIADSFIMAFAPIHKPFHIPESMIK